ncbi:hypothetical protein [Formosa algae]|uniref:Site-specific recombinase n=1 Tax=Formosa algae TaxID=225843 RepID=A0A9X0YPG1_9FLAO|nr:hypothetical protein [Formosa algae]MBP1840608.1 site-specific recombinase [Formosa algae]MDQ0335979.1 site-specific recombinase [Formosa algae]
MISNETNPKSLEFLNFYSFFTKYSLMEEYGFSSGIINRFYRKILPNIPEPNTVEYVLLKKENPVSYVLSLIDFKTISRSHTSKQLDLSIKALCAKVVAFGLDSNIKAKSDYLELNTEPFIVLLEKINHLSHCEREDTLDLINTLKDIERLIIDLRKNKNKIGTSLHLTLTTRRILEYTTRIKELLFLKLNISSEKYWKNILTDFITYAKHKDSIRRYISRHSDLLAIEIVEHNSNKGEKYIAETRKEYWNFFNRSLFGGSIIALFAFIKLILTSYDATEFTHALLYSLNYALCFIIVKELGGIIATKQPAMTATTLAKNIDKEGNMKYDSIKSIIYIVRKVFRSQFISVMGNFIMAILFACGLMFILQQIDTQYVNKMVKPEYLISKILPNTQLLFFAAMAGFFLALSGLISGYVDNKVIASKVAHRISNNKLFFNSNRLATFFEKKAGTFFGNISLGFFLGSSFLLSHIFPFEIDIRHVAFSSANLGFAIMNYDFSIKIMLLGISGALLIGLVNFIVSFSITFYLALKSRGVNFRLLPKVLFNIFKDMCFHPFHYFIKIEKEPITTTSKNE